MTDAEPMVRVKIDQRRLQGLFDALVALQNDDVDDILIAHAARKQQDTPA